MQLIFLLLRTSWLILSLAVFAGFLNGASSAGLLALINYTLRHPEQLSATLAWRFISLCLLLPISNVSARICLNFLAQRVIFDLRMVLSRQILACPLRRLEEIGGHRLLATLTDDIQAVANAFTVIHIFCVNVAILIVCLAYLSWLSWPVFLVLCVCMIVGIFSNRLLAAKARRFLKLAREEQDKLFHHFRAIIEGTKELKIHRQRRQAFLSEELQATAASSRHHNFVGLNIFAVAMGWGLLLFFVPIGLILFSLPRLMPIAPSVLSGYVLTIIFLMGPINSILNQLPTLNSAGIAVQKIESMGLFLKAYATERNLPTEPIPKTSWQLLELIGVTHAYRGEREEDSFVLGPIDLAFQPGELVFIVGGNGSGKSTLAKLMTGLYIPETGEIRFDGEPITDENRHLHNRNVLW